MLGDDLAKSVFAQLPVINLSCSRNHLEGVTQSLKGVVGFRVIPLLGGDIAYGRKRTAHGSVTKALGLRLMATCTGLIPYVSDLRTDIPVRSRKRQPRIVLDDD